ncbi:hypothetical protein EX30DRAFT_22872 [Ascodesmis nigricans]|uniref:Cytidyltransferase-like domain-containing protein n=1 Tax=Ascodesmis nigricans TaxID=341454 RepID=A0A4V3SJV0_9PEZI|nr:hypothetical protein EX30DRAFT_22872 [Ascodesmis nigricans]
MSPITTTSPSPPTLLLLPHLPPSALLPTLTPHLTSLPANTRVYLALPAPFQTSNRVTSFPAASKLFAETYAAIFQLSLREKLIETLDIIVVLTSEDAPDGASVVGPVVKERILRDAAWARVVEAEKAPLEETEVVKQQPSGEIVVDVGRGGQHRVVAVGGTFDHLHLGHRLLLSMTTYALSPYADAAESTRKKKIVVGVSGDSLLANKKHSAYLESWRDRVEATLAFLISSLSPLPSGPAAAVVDSTAQVLAPDAKMFQSGRCVTATLPNGVIIECLELFEPCGPTITDPEITTLVVTEETAAGGKFVNDTRKGKELRELVILMVGLVGGEGAEKLSSTDLRKREGEEKGRRRESKA